MLLWGLEFEGQVFFLLWGFEFEGQGLEVRVTFQLPGCLVLVRKVSISVMPRRSRSTSRSRNATSRSCDLGFRV